MPLTVRRPRLRRSAARYAEVETFDALDEVAIVDVDLPRASLPEMRSRTVQPEVAPELIAPAHESAFALRVSGTLTAAGISDTISAAGSSTAACAR